MTTAHRVINTKISENKSKVIFIDIYIENKLINAQRKVKKKVDRIMVKVQRPICNFLKVNEMRLK